jgi:hypothetical protein
MASDSDHRLPTRRTTEHFLEYKMTRPVTPLRDAGKRRPDRMAYAIAAVIPIVCEAAAA